MFGPRPERIDRKAERSASVETHYRHAGLTRCVFLRGLLRPPPQRLRMNFQMTSRLLEAPPPSWFAHFRHKLYCNSTNLSKQVENTSNSSIAATSARPESARAVRWCTRIWRTDTCCLVTGAVGVRVASNPDARDDSPSGWRSTGTTFRRPASEPAIRRQPSDGRDAEQRL